MKNFVLFVLKFYKRYLSPVIAGTFGGGCRFTPTCSEYTIEAVEKFGSIKGIQIGMKRFLRCNPWGSSGYDPVPAK